MRAGVTSITCAYSKHGAPACYLAQPATWSLTTYYSRPGQHHTRHAAAGPAGTAPAGPGAG